MAIININKGLIGLEDVYTGSNATFSRLKSDGTSQTITKGLALESAGNGTLRLHDDTVNTSGSSAEVYTDSIVGYAYEAVTTTTSVSRIRVEVR